MRSRAVVGVVVALLVGAGTWAATANANIDVSGWQVCADENGPCQVPADGGNRMVSFGPAGGHITTQRFPAGTAVPCDVATFGEPAPNEHKECRIAPDNLVTMWVHSWRTNDDITKLGTFCAFEGGTCFVRAGDQPVMLFGERTFIASKIVDEKGGQIPCTVDYFGSNPSPNPKECRIYTAPLFPEGAPR